MIRSYSIQIAGVTRNSDDRSAIEYLLNFNKERCEGFSVDEMFTDHRMKNSSNRTNLSLPYVSLMTSHKGVEVPLNILLLYFSLDSFLVPDLHRS